MQLALLCCSKNDSRRCRCLAVTRNTQIKIIVLILCYEYECYDPSYDVAKFGLKITECDHLLVLCVKTYLSKACYYLSVVTFT